MEWCRSMYLFYAHYPSSRWTHSLYKLDFQLRSESEAAPAASELTPVAQFPKNGEHPYGMRCAVLGSKLYMLGGEVPRKSDEGAFPRDVYVFDMISAQLTKLDARLNTGKPGPCVFAANGKLYALGSILCIRLSLSDLAPLKDIVSSIKPFECYDPTTNKWQVLEDPPVDVLVNWMGCTVLENRQQVVLLGWEPCREDTVRVVYDLNNGTWTRSGLSHTEVSISFQEGDGGRFLYGLPPYGFPVKTQHGLLSYHDEMAFTSHFRRPHGVVDMCSDQPTQDWLPIFSLIKQQYVDCDRLLRYAGADHFCYVVYGNPPHPDGVDSDGYLPPDHKTNAVTITLFKEIETKGISFKAKILHSQEYLMRTSFYSLGELVGCFVVTPDQQHSEDQRHAKLLPDSISKPNDANKLYHGNWSLQPCHKDKSSHGKDVLQNFVERSTEEDSSESKSNSELQQQKVKNKKKSKKKNKKLAHCKYLIL